MKNSEWKATAQYKAGNFDKATEQFQQTGNFYNQGNALAKKGQLKEALAAYEQAVKENPYDHDAKFNKGIIEKELQKQQQKNKEDKPQNSQKSDSDKNEKSDKNSQKQQSDNEDSDSKPEQKEEHKAGDNPEKKEDSKEEQSKQESKSQSEKDKESKDKSKNEAKKQVEVEKSTAEQVQANEQWLKRIPDDPATLLKRKFKYQYSQEQ